MRNHCDVKRCQTEVGIVYLSICAYGHIDEYYLCPEHAVTIWIANKNCSYEHSIVDHMAATTNGDEPEDYRFYLGEWVAVQDNKVIGHAVEPQSLVQAAIGGNRPGTNVWKVEERHVQERHGS